MVKQSRGRPIPNNAGRLLAGLTLLGLSLRLAALGFDHVLTPDGVDYVTLSGYLTGGYVRAAINAWTPPLYPILIFLSSTIVGDHESAGRLVSVVSGSLLVIPVFFLLRRAYDRRTATWGAVLTTLHPLFIYYSTQVLTEATYTLCFFCLVFAGWQALTTKRTRYFALTGLMVGVCYLLRAEAFGFIFLLLAVTLAAGLADKTVSKKHLLMNCLALAACFIVLIAPYLIHLRIENGFWTISAKLSGHLWQGNRGLDDNAVKLVEYPLMPSFPVMFTQFAKAVRSELELLNFVFPPTFVALAALGLFGNIWTRERARFELYLLLFLIAALVGYAITLPNVRFFVPLVPLTLGWVMRGAFTIEGWVRKTLLRTGVDKHRRFAQLPFIPILIGILVLSVMPLFFYLMRGDKWHDYNGQKQAAIWIKEHHTGGQPRIMAAVPIAAHYAGGIRLDSLALQDEPYEALLQRAHHEGADYILVNERDVSRMQLWPLLEENLDHPGLQQVYKVTPAPGHKILVYAVNK